MREFWFAVIWTVIGGVIADLGLVGVVTVTSTGGQVASIIAAWAGILLLFVVCYVEMNKRAKREIPYQELPLTQTTSTEL